MNKVITDLLGILGILVLVIFITTGCANQQDHSIPVADALDDINAEAQNQDSSDASGIVEEDVDELGVSALDMLPLDFDDDFGLEDDMGFLDDLSVE